MCSSIPVKSEEISHDNDSAPVVYDGVGESARRKGTVAAPTGSGVGGIGKWTGITQAKGCRCGGEVIGFRPTLRRRSLVVISERNRRHCRICSGPYSKRGGYTIHTYAYVDHHRLSHSRNERLNGAKRVLIMVHFYISPSLR